MGPGGGSALFSVISATSVLSCTALTPSVANACRFINDSCWKSARRRVGCEARCSAYGVRDPVLTCLRLHRGGRTSWQELPQRPRCQPLRGRTSTHLTRTDHTHTHSRRKMGIEVNGLDSHGQQVRSECKSLSLGHRRISAPRFALLLRFGRFDSLLMLELASCSLSAGPSRPPLAAETPSLFAFPSLVGALPKGHPTADEIIYRASVGDSFQSFITPGSAPPRPHARKLVH